MKKIIYILNDGQEVDRAGLDQVTQVFFTQHPDWPFQCLQKTRHPDQRVDVQIFKDPDAQLNWLGMMSRVDRMNRKILEHEACHQHDLLGR